MPKDREPNGEYTLFLEKGQSASDKALKIVQRLAPSVEIVYVEERNPETPTPHLHERFGATFYGLRTIRAHIEHQEKIRNART